MVLLSSGIVVFVGIHLVPTFPKFRKMLVQQMSENPYKGVFSLIAAIGLGLIIWGKANAVFIPLWNPPVWGRHLTMGFMLFSMISMAAVYLPTNLKRLTRHPMLWSVTFWSIGHLAANGDLASVILFGGLGSFALYDRVSANQRGTLKSQTRYPLSNDILVVGGGILMYGLIIFLHPYLFGVPAVLF